MHLNFYRTAIIKDDDVSQQLDGSAQKKVKKKFVKKRLLYFEK